MSHQIYLQMKMSNSQDMKSAQSLPPSAIKVPAPAVQKQIIKGLTAKSTTYRYLISKKWHARWQEFVDNSPVKKDSIAPPGPVYMNCDDDSENEFIGEKEWGQFVMWYGLVESHEIDRECNTVYSEISQSFQGRKKFQICIFSPYTHLIKHRVKTIDTRDVIGYIENQVRRILKIMPDQKTRLWIARQDESKFQLLLDRKANLLEAYEIEETVEYILSLEVKNVTSTWPTNVPGEPNGHLVQPFEDNPMGDDIEGLFDQHLRGIFHTLNAVVKNSVQETCTHYMNHIKSIVNTKETQLALMRKDLYVRSAEVQEAYKSLNEREQLVHEGEDQLDEMLAQYEVNKNTLQEDKQKFQQEKHKMEELYKIQDSLVRVSIGGHIFMTSLLTLTKDEGSMLAAMFSGRHPVKQEEDGSYFIDRDGTNFRYILNYLRDGCLKESALPKDKALYRELLQEAEYYQLQPLTDYLRGLLKAPPVPSRQNLMAKTRPTYL